ILPIQGADGCYVKLTNISYTPTQQTIILWMFSHPMSIIRPLTQQVGSQPQNSTTIPASQQGYSSLPVAAIIVGIVVVVGALSYLKFASKKKVENASKKRSRKTR